MRSERRAWRRTGGLPSDRSLQPQQGDLDGLLELRRDGHQAQPNRATYAALRETSTSLGCWDVERPQAVVVLGRANPGELAAVLLSEGRVDEAWATFQANGSGGLREKDVLSLIEARGADHPGDALDAYLRLADAHLVSTGKEHYERAVRVLKKAVGPAGRSRREAELRAHVAQLREAHKRRPTLIAMLDRAGLELGRGAG